jgi:hypothetical protein
MDLGFFAPGRAVVRHNTILSTGGPAISIGGFPESESVIANNILVAPPEVPAVYCGRPIPLRIESNNVVSESEEMFSEGCGGSKLLEDNLFHAPGFSNPEIGDYHLSPDSPNVDAGVDEGVSEDFDGDERTLDGNGDGEPGFDIGFDEHNPVGPTASPTSTASPTPTATRGPCPGDCNCDGVVKVAELITAVSIALEELPMARCAKIDVNQNGRASIGEMLLAVESSLHDCR